MGAYNVSKHGVVTLSETLYGELRDAGSNVGVSVLCPGIIRTNLRNSERNRPDHLRDLEPEEVQARIESTPGFSDTVRLRALSPEWAAECVFEGIKANRFYILTHDDHEGQIARRHDAIQNDGTPAVVRSTVFAGGPIER